MPRFGLADPARFFCGDNEVGGGSSFTSRLPFEKSSLRLTFVDTEAALGSTIEPRTGEDTGPIEGFRLAGEFKYVFIGDLDFGGGNRMLMDARCVRRSVGSGIVPIERQ